MLSFAKSYPRLFWSTCLASFALSAFLIALDPIINNDGMIYAAVAQRFIEGDWLSAFSSFSLPVFSLIVAGIVKISGFNPETSAYITSSIFVCITCLGFVACVGLLSDGNQRIMIIAALVILLLPSISKYRSFIIRDFAYLACYFWAIYYLLRYLQARHYLYLGTSLLLFLLSANFRLEGILFFALTPIAIFYAQATSSSRLWKQRILVVLLLPLALFIILAVSEHLGYSFFSTLKGSEASFLEKVGMIAERLTGRMELKESAFALVQMCFEVIRRLAIVFFILALYALINGWPKTTSHQQIIRIFIVANILILSAFTLLSGITVSRYTLALVLTLLLAAPFALDQLLLSRPQGVTKIAKYLLFTLIIVTFLQGLNRPTDKHYLKEAGSWVASNLTGGGKVMSNNRVVQFYASPRSTEVIGMHYSRPIFIALLEQQRLQTYAAVTYEVEKNNVLMKRVLGTLRSRFGPPVAQFGNGKNRKVYIFFTR